jgi:hypothetical protein
MTDWDETYSHNFLLALDLWAALVFFNRAGITISTMSGMVRDGKDGPLKLWGWQRSFLRWLEPRLGRAHVTGALKADRGRAQFIIDNTPGTPS